MMSGFAMYMAGNLEAGRELLEQARDLSRRVGDPDVEGLASIYLGHALVTSGDTKAGLAMVDEATAAAMSGARRAGRGIDLLQHHLLLPQHR